MPEPMSSRITAIQSKMKSKRLSISRLCRDLELSRTSWYRWLNDYGAPDVLIWEIIQEYVENFRRT